MLRPSFQTYVNVKIEKGRICAGKFDGERVSLAIGLGNNKILLHDATENSQEGGRMLTLRGETSVLKAIQVHDENPIRDSLVVGSSSSLLAYDIHDNADVFYVDLPDGVHSIERGTLNGNDLIFVGGNGSVHGIGLDGSEQFWTVIGGTATSLAMSDFARKGTNSLIVGSDDFDLRVFASEESSTEITEAESITHLCILGDGSRFAYGLSNGTVGVYDGGTRVWRVKGKDTLCSLTAFDIDGDGVKEVISGWSNGRFEARRDENGSLVYRETMGHAVNGLMTADFRNTGTEELICCTYDGEIRGYAPASLKASNNTDGTVMPTGTNIQNVKGNDGELVATILGRKSRDTVQNQSKTKDGNQEELAEVQRLLTLKMMELRSLEDSLANLKSNGTANLVGSLPDNTNITVEVRPNVQMKCLEIVCDSNDSGVLIQSIVVLDLDGGLFSQECLAQAVYPASERAVMPFVPERDASSNLKIQIFVSARGAAECLHVFEHSVQIRKMSMLVSLPDVSPKQVPRDTVVKFKVANGVDAIRAALDEVIDMSNVQRGKESRDTVFWSFVNMRDEKNVAIRVAPSDRTDTSVELLNFTMANAGVIVQSLGSSLNLTSLESIAEFPEEMLRTRELLSLVLEQQTIRQRFAAEMADESHLIKNYIIRAEDARLINDTNKLRNTYRELTTINEKLIMEYRKRAANQASLTDALRTINQYIQNASLLRVGPPQSGVVAAARKALKSKDATALCNALTMGN